MPEKKNPNLFREPKSGKLISPVVPNKVSIEDVIEKIRQLFKIDEGDVIIIKEVYAQTMDDKDLIRLISANKENKDLLQQNIAGQIRQMIIETYKQKGQVRMTREPQYKDAGGIFDLLVENIIRHAVYS